MDPTISKDLAAKDALIAMWKQRCEGMEQALLGERSLAGRLVKLLGFESVGEAVLFVETQQGDVRYRECLERGAGGEVVKRDLEHRITHLEASKTALETKYDTLERTFKKTQTKHAQDNAKFIRWKQWFWGEWEVDKGMDEGEVAKKWAMGFLRRRKVVAGRGEGVFDEVPGKSDFEGGPQGEESPVKGKEKGKGKGKGSDATATTTTPKPSSSTALPLTPTTKNNRVVPPPSPRRDDSLSSDTEDTPHHPSSQTSGSVTEDDSQPLYAQVTPTIVKPPQSPSPSRYLKRTQGFAASTSGHDHSASPRSSPTREPARKRRRMSLDNGKAIAGGTPKPLVWSPSQIRMPPPVSTPVEVPKIRNKLGDYSAYKGRGRYARKDDDEDKTLNEMFEVDADLNEGLGYQFEEVVRGRESRRKMNAGDCEECREYYKAIGPMPPRSKQPLWRSPVRENKHPGPSTSCNHHKGNHRAQAGTPPSPTPGPSDIDSHRQEISRHRYNWERPKTPPGYWDIGFPDTQRAEDINEKAKELHREKYKAVEREVERGGGRYKRR
ncbi:hypothetical protein PQX77_009935 [Marasmius sp. AFHP31]|nr:hypothetical protein PQX77_009935 [Marasmius sp. AFHP31]